MMHKPLWIEEVDNVDLYGTPRKAHQTGFAEIMTVLADRKHSVFAGYVHNYAKFKRNEYNYYKVVYKSFYLKIILALKYFVFRSTVQTDSFLQKPF